MKKKRQLNFLITGTGWLNADKNRFLARLADALPGTSVFQQKKGMGTLEGNYRGALRQLRVAVQKHKPSRVVVVGHSEGAMHAMRLVKQPFVDLSIACTPAICTHLEVAWYQFRVRPPVSRDIRRMLNSQPYAKPSKRPGEKDRAAVRKMFKLLGWPCPAAQVKYTVSLLSFDGQDFVPDEGREKLICAFSKNDMNVPSELSIRNLRKIAPSIPIKMLCASDHNFRTKKGPISRTAVRQVVALTRPNKRIERWRAR